MEIRKINHSPSRRVLYYDVLRIIGTIAVIMLHCAAEKWRGTNGIEYKWQVFNAYNSMVRFCVPLFVMLTGSTMGNPDKELSVEKLWRKNIFRLVVAYIFWHLFYVFTTPQSLSTLLKAFPDEVLTMLRAFSGSHYHLWFMFMIICIYTIIPLLRLVTKSDKGLKYAIRIGIIFSFIIPTILNFPIISTQRHIAVIFEFFQNHFFHLTSYHLNFEFITYFFVGYYLSTLKIDKKRMRAFLCIGLLGWLSTLLLSAFGAWYNRSSFAFYEYNYFNVFCEAIGVYVVTKYLVENHTFKNGTVKMIRMISNYSFGIYLVHVFVLERLTDLGFTTLRFNPLIATPGKAILTFIISLILSAAIHRIPILRKYIV